MSDQTMPYSHGEVCEHDKLKRQCNDCWNEWEIGRLRFIIALLRAEVIAWRQSQAEIRHYERRDAVDAAMAATDAAGALEDK